MPVITDYHERTKHHPNRYANGPGFMDWANQPNPFRFYHGAESITLDLLRSPSELPFHRLFESPSVDPATPDEAHIGGFLERSLGLSAWKAQGGAEWSLRINPSSGNLHPTECHLILPASGNLPACIAHYNPLLHRLEIRSRLDQKAARELAEMNGFALVLSSIFWREAWKYGERAFRYTQHDIGHALAAVRFSSTLCGWNLRVRTEIPGDLLDQLLGFGEADHTGEKERADCLCWVETGPDASAAEALPAWLNALEPAGLVNEPNQLSRKRVEWPVIDQAVSASLSPGFSRKPLAPCEGLPCTPSSQSAESIIRRRRSAQAYDPGRSRIPLKDFYRMLAVTLPFKNPAFDTLGSGTNIHLLIFVHRVDDLESGLYCLLRGRSDLVDLSEGMDQEFRWSRVDRNLPLYLLRPGDFRMTAEQISCHQPIAGDSAFSLGMLARFDELLATKPWLYPQLFWEAGFIGQILYLAAEERGLRGTGIGCYFDDFMHRLLGLNDNSWQDLYHFTVGAPLEDSRVQTKPPYYHLERFPDR